MVRSKTRSFDFDWLFLPVLQFYMYWPGVGLESNPLMYVCCMYVCMYVCLRDYKLYSCCAQISLAPMLTYSSLSPTRFATYLLLF